MAMGRTKLEQFITGLDFATADAAMMMAMEAIDAGSFSRPTMRSTEKFWRRGGIFAIPARRKPAELRSLSGLNLTRA